LQEEEHEAKLAAESFAAGETKPTRVCDVEGAGAFLAGKATEVAVF